MKRIGSLWGCAALVLAACGSAGPADGGADLASNDLANVAADLASNDLANAPIDALMGGAFDACVLTCCDGKHDGDETDLDCGGSCGGCPIGKACLGDRDCASGSCANHLCRVNPCADGKQDGQETDLDCGGPVCLARCATGKSCLVDRDCQGALCVAKVCAERYSPSMAFATGGAPVAVTIADLDGDGKPDVATADKGGTATVLLGAGGGQLKAPAMFPVGGLPSALAAADLDLDGKLDLAVVHDGVKNLAAGAAVLLGKGGGSFQAPLDTPTGSEPVAVVARDFDGDGKIDLAVLNRYASTVSILRSLGGGKLAPAVDLKTDGKPASLAAADLNGDGRADLAVGGERLQVFLNDGHGGFGAPSNFQLIVGGDGVYVRAGDIDNDGHADLVEIGGGIGAVKVVFLRGDGKGGFAAPQVSVIATLLGVYDAALADVDGDGKLDLLALDDRLNLLLGAGDGTFAAAGSWKGSQRPGGLAVADLNGDGKMDAVTVDATAGEVRVFLNAGP